MYCHLSALKLFWGYITEGDIDYSQDFEALESVYESFIYNTSCKLSRFVVSLFSVYLALKASESTLPWKDAQQWPLRVVEHQLLG